MPQIRGLQTAVPVIETARLRLRGHRHDDLPHCVAMWSDPIVTRFIGGVPSGEQRTWARLLAYVGHWVLMGFGYWVIEERETSKFVGEIGFADFKREGAALLRAGPELGFALAPSFHGKGYATEAVRAALAWVNECLPRGQCMCLVDAENAASLRILGNVGFEVLERNSLNGRQVIYLSTPIGTER
jgi:RimJ/RimL family protein N-acetyltransferase